MKMKILIVSATEKEIEPLMKILEVKKFFKDFKICRFKNSEVHILISGTGMVSTTYFLTKAISKKYDLAMNLGIAGSFKKNIKIGEVVNVVKDRFSELGAEDGEKFISLNEMNLKGENEFENKNSIREIREIRVLKKVSGITVNTVHGNESSIKKVVKKFNPDIETMEGAAFIFVCRKEKIPCVQIRAISNFVERRNKKNWNIPLAIKNLNETAIQILQKLC